jgi:uncharacterized protein YndB with AHSA1/START domain
MKPIILTVVITLLIIAGVLLVGALLPETRSATVSRTIDADPERVRATILDVERQPSWRAHIRSVTRGPDGGWTERTRDGEQIAFRLVEDANGRIAMSFESTRGYTGRWAAELAPTAAGGTRLTVVEQASTPSPIGRILARMFFDPEAFANAYLDALAAEAVRRKQTAE